MTDRTINWVFRATDKTAQAFRSVDSKLAGITKSLRSFAGFAGFATIAAGVGALGKQLVQLGSDLQDASDKLGVSAEKLQVLKFAAEQTGGSFDGLQAALAFNTKLTGEAVRGNEKAAETFRLLGLDAQKFAQLPIDRRLAVIAEQLKNVEDPALRLDLTLKALGRGGADLAPLLAQGAAGLAAFENQLRTTNALISDEQIKALDDAGDAWELFKTRVLASAAPVFAGTLEGFQGLIDIVGRYAAALNDGKLYLTNDGFEIRRPGRGRPGGGRSDLRLLNDAEEAARVGEAGVGQSNAQLAAVEKAAKAASKAQGEAAREAARYAEEVQRLVEGIAELSREADRTFQERAADINEQYRAPLDTLVERVEEINALFQAGAISSDVANRAIRDYGDAYGAAMERVLGKTEEVKSAQEKMFDQLKLAADGWARDLTDIFFDTTQSIGDMFKGLAETIAKALFTTAVTEPFINSILGSFGGASGLGSLFGGARAAGGPVTGGKAYLVGERGPELFVPGAGGRIVPNGEPAAVPIQVNLTITSVDPQTAAQTIAAQERLITGMVRRAMHRAGVRPQLA